MDYISFELVGVHASFKSLNAFRDHCLEKASSVDGDGIIYFEDDSYIRFHDNTFSLGSPMEMEWL